MLPQQNAAMILLAALAPSSCIAFAPIIPTTTTTTSMLTHYTPTSISISSSITTSTSTSTINTKLFAQQPLIGKEVSPLFYAAAGSPPVDMNRYNLPLTQIINEWTAVLQPKTSMQAEGIFLQTKSTKEFFVDTLQYKLKREGGLGMILTELAGGRDDGIGITIVEEVLEGGNAENCGIVAGDSIIALTLNSNDRDATSTSSNSNDSDTNTMVVQEESLRISTECLAYDPTITALTSLPPPSTPLEEIIITVKRIRRQPTIQLKLQYPPDMDEPDATIELFAGENLRRALLTRGIKLNDPLAQRFDSGGLGDCGADGTCATCVIGVVKGMELLSPMKQQEGQILKNKPKWRMACKTVVGHGMTEGEMTVQVSPRQWAN
jgi:ferredoxin